MHGREVVIIDAVRTPSGRGKPGGGLSHLHPVDLLAHAFSAILKRNPGLEADRIDDVIVGCVTQAGEQAGNIARNAALTAGIPQEVPATTVDRQCGSSQQAVSFAAHGIAAGSYDAVLVGGVESMSRVPMLLDRGDADTIGAGLRAIYPDGFISQGVAAELVAARWKLSRSQLDVYSARSHARATQAAKEGRFDREIVPVPGAQPDLPVLEMDETIRPGTDEAALARLEPAFRTPQHEERLPELAWSVTPGNSSPLTDGAAAALLMDAGAAQRQGLAPRARYVDGVAVGDDPLLMLMGVVPATERLLARNDLTVADIDAFEVNEAFASVPLAWQAETGADPERLNQHGGAIALGHPLGASGVRILATLMSVLEQNRVRYGVQVMCEAGGMANATLIEALD